METFTIGNICAKLVNTLLTTKAHKTTKYMSDKYVIKATRKHSRPESHDRPMNNILITFGKPNYAERKFIKKCKKAKETFPVKKIQIKN